MVRDGAFGRGLDRGGTADPLLSQQLAVLLGGGARSEEAGHWGVAWRGRSSSLVPPFCNGLLASWDEELSSARPFHHALPALASSSYGLNPLKTVSQNKPLLF